MHLEKVVPAARVIAFVLACASLPAQAFIFPDFSSVANLAFNGSTVQAGNVLQLTSTLTGQAGSAWYTTAQPVVNGFDTVFQIRITPAGSPADGMAFALHNDPAGTAALGAPGGALGYQGLATLFNSIVVEFDTYPNGEFGETTGNVISVHTNGGGPTSAHEALSLGSITPPVTMADGQPHLARVEFLAVPGTLNVYLDNLSMPLLSMSYSFSSGGTFAGTGLPVAGPSLPGGLAYVGFTGGTGGLTEINAVESWTWASAPATSLTLSITQPFGPGSAAVQVVNGIPVSPQLTALTFDPLNASNPSQGWWGGLHIAFTDLVAQYLFFAPPFVGVLDVNGASLFTLPGGLPSGLPTLYSVTRTFGPGLVTITGTSNIVSVQLL